MYRPINGWTKEKIKEALVKGNNGYKAFDVQRGSCVYLAPDGNKCAVGCFIPDGHPAQKYPGGVKSLVYEFPDLCRKLPLHPSSLHLLQNIHDNGIPKLGGKNIREMMLEWVDLNVSDEEVNS